MELKYYELGERFEFEGKTYQVEKDKDDGHCEQKCLEMCGYAVCTAGDRGDCYVWFKEVEEI